VKPFQFVHVKDTIEAIAATAKSRTAQQGADIRFIAGGTFMQPTKTSRADNSNKYSRGADQKAEATEGNFTTSDAIPWKPVDPKNHPGLMMFVVSGNPNTGASLILQKYPAGMERYAFLP
jgi:hypothetical protein